MGAENPPSFIGGSYGGGATLVLNCVAPGRPLFYSIIQRPINSILSIIIIIIYDLVVQ